MNCLLCKTELNTILFSGNFYCDNYDCVRSNCINMGDWSFWNSADCYIIHFKFKENYYKIRGFKDFCKTSISQLNGTLQINIDLIELGENFVHQLNKILNLRLFI